MTQISKQAFKAKQAEQTPLQMANYLGTGENPHLVMKLSANGPDWGSYTIDYGQEGSIPYASDIGDGWSTWNVYDEDNNYYGTITISSDNQTVKWNDYTAPNPATGYYLDGLQLTWNDQEQAFDMTVDNIYQPSNQNNAGPFPDAPRATPAVFNGTNTPIELSVEGNKIVDQGGREINLKGVVRPSLEWNDQGQYLSPDDIANMAKWGSNVIRLDLNQQFWLESESADVEGSYKQIIDAIIYYATQNNMAVILDLHWTDSQAKQAPMANNDSLRFWTEVATAYKDFGTVIFELFNEPHDIDNVTWKDGNNEYVGYQELYDAVRRTGAENLVIANGNAWGYDLSFVNDDFKLNGYNIIYGSHPYNNKGAPDYTGAGGSLDNNFKGILGNYPIIFTEFGDNQSDDYANGTWVKPYVRNIAYAQKNGVHTTGFAWWVDPSDPAFPTMISDFNGTPLNGGKLIYYILQHSPGTNIFEAPANINVLKAEEPKPSVAKQITFGFTQRKTTAPDGTVAEEISAGLTCSIL